MILVGNYMHHLIVKIFKLLILGQYCGSFLAFEKISYDPDMILSVSSTQFILANKLMIIDDKAGRRYFEGSLKFQATLTSVLNMLTQRISLMAQQDIYGANVSQMWGIALLLFVMFLSPILIILAKNAISSIQLFAGKYSIMTHK